MSGSSNERFCKICLGRSICNDCYREEILKDLAEMEMLIQQQVLGMHLNFTRINVFGELILLTS